MFSGLTFAGLIYTLVLQKLELIRQHKQIEEVKTDSKKQFETSLKASKLSALCSIFQHHTDISLHSRESYDKAQSKKYLKVTAARIEKILEEFDEDMGISIVPKIRLNLIDEANLNNILNSLELQSNVLNAKGNKDESEQEKLKHVQYSILEIKEYLKA